MAKLVGTDVGNPFLYTTVSGRGVVVQTIYAPLEILLVITRKRSKNTVTTILSLLIDFDLLLSDPYLKVHCVKKVSIFALLTRQPRLFNAT